VKKPVLVADSLRRRWLCRLECNKGPGSLLILHPSPWAFSFDLVPALAPLLHSNRKNVVTQDQLEEFHTWENKQSNKQKQQIHSRQMHALSHKQHNHYLSSNHWLTPLQHTLTKNHEQLILPLASLQRIQQKTKNNNKKTNKQKEETKQKKTPRSDFPLILNTLKNWPTWKLVRPFSAPVRLPDQIKICPKNWNRTTRLVSTYGLTDWLNS